MPDAKMDCQVWISLAAAKIAETLNMNELSASGRIFRGDEGTQNFVVYIAIKLSTPRLCLLFE
jgi:hypothetical protein